ncbi:alpha-ketoglutarate-dependent dioxygenase alkB 2 [Rhypophila decipiens]|uniref:Alpha-ketoglutarate-dependent dioxygenase alkB 2 n=1 Tax=Rhypophila decipiens TaxID=261697 RepID=A0AAN6Y8G7_9PEZI|nr:alpha-ketoglutarate-dependent dioxygenase alkB 2 [Rhypophila decipiens]
MFNINLAAIPSIPTRKALIIIDLQNDFISPDAVLAVVEPEGFVSRTLDLARSFRSSGAGDVIWVRSEFQRHRPLTAEGDQIITSDLPQRPASNRPSARGRQPSSKVHDGALMEMDDESFLSVSQGTDKPICVRKGTKGAEFPAQVQEAIDSRDIVFTKTHYSAFAQQELVQMLRGRLVTEMFVCGSLTNIGIYATALDAGRHGYEMTLVEDCCGFRSEMRHINAVRQLMQLVGSEAMTAETIMEKLQPTKPKVTANPKPPPPPETPPKGQETGSENTSERGSGAGQKSPVRPQLAAQLESQVPSSMSSSTCTPISTGLSPSLSKVSLNRDDESPAATSPPRPAPEQVSEPVSQVHMQGQEQGESAGTEGAVQTVVKDSDRPSTAEPACNSRPSFWVDSSAPLEADSDPESDTSSPDFDRLVGESRYRGSAAAEMRSRMSRAADVHVRPSTSYSPRSGRHGVTGTTATQRPASGGQDSSPAAPERTPTRIAVRTRLPLKNKLVGSHRSTASSSSSSSRSSKETQGDQQPAPRTATATPPKSPNMADQDRQDEGPSPIFTKPICEGDTTIILNALSPSLASTAFDRLLAEVSWAGMSRMGGEVPRRIAVQGEVDDQGNMPVYRHPADESPPLLPFSPTVQAIKQEIEKHLGHPLNHVLIQHYRSGNDYISEHSDKTLDIVPGSFIANVSLGAERTMVFRTKRPPKPDDTQSTPAQGGPRKTERAPLPHNSLCRMGLLTNKRWLHAIRQDKRLDKEKSQPELSHSGQRISLTFRQIGTFLDCTQTKIWGQGAVSKSQSSPGDVLNGQEHPKTVKMLQAFGAENNNPDFVWDEKYGTGFDVLHMGSPKRFSSGGDSIQNLRVRIALAELGVGGCASGSVEGDTVRFEDNDPSRAVIDGHENVLRYLDAVYGVGRRYDQLSFAEVARRFVRLQGALDVLPVWRAAKNSLENVVVEEEERVRKLDKMKGFKAALVQWEGFAKESATAAAAAAAASEPAFYIAGGDKPSPADFALWPVLDDIVRFCGEGAFDIALDKAQAQPQTKNLSPASKAKQQAKDSGSYLARYYKTFGERSAVRKVVAVEGGPGIDAKT